MARQIEELLNLGPKSARALAAIGVHNEDDLRTLGVIPAYRRLKHAEPTGTSLNMLYAMQGALMDIHWNQLPLELKADLKHRLDGS